MFTINTNSILTRAVVLAGSAGLLASLGARRQRRVRFHSPQPDAHRDDQIVNRYDGGGSGYWAYDSFGRVLNLQIGKVTPAMIAANPALASTPYMYTATLTDKGTFKDIPGVFTPNQGGCNAARRTLRPTQVTGTMSGYGDFAVFYASQKAAGYRGDAYRSRLALRGSARNLHYPSSTWPELAFANGTMFAGVSVARLQLHLHRHQDRSWQARPGSDLGG